MIGFRKILYLLIIIACFCLPDNLFSQSPTNLDNKVLLTKEYNFFAMAHTEGWGIGGRFGRNQTFYKQRMMEFELLNMKHPKEIHPPESKCLLNNFLYFFLPQSSKFNKKAKDSFLSINICNFSENNLYVKLYNPSKSIALISDKDSFEKNSDLSPIFSISFFSA